MRRQLRGQARHLAALFLQQLPWKLRQLLLPRQVQWMLQQSLRPLQLLWVLQHSQLSLQQQQQQPSYHQPPQLPLPPLQHHHQRQHQHRMAMKQLLQAAAEVARMTGQVAPRGVVAVAQATPVLPVEVATMVAGHPRLAPLEQQRQRQTRAGPEGY